MRPPPGRSVTSGPGVPPRVFSNFLSGSIRFESREGALQLEFLPGYAPELNPVEAIWCHLKPHEMANFLAENFVHLNHFARNRLRSMQRRPRLIAAFWKQAELPL